MRELLCNQTGLPRRIKGIKERLVLPPWDYGERHLEVVTMLVLTAWVRVLLWSSI